jgi:nitroimidazol reductase NimA-like FMN-containing flavoprotein (pyridoxamine 5'-phosphate oxidase superfamily)
MQAYGVGGPAWTALPWSWAAERLTGARNFWVVTVSAAGRPHALPVWGVWDDDWAFAFSCAPSARKARNLAANPAMTVMTESTVECLSVEGRARAVESDGRRERWIERYVAKYGPLEPNLTADFVRQHLLFEFAPERALAVIERTDEFATRATRWVFGS